MENDTQQMTIGMTAIVMVAIVIALACTRCDKQRVQLATDCIRAGRPAVECKLLMGER